MQVFPGFPLPHHATSTPAGATGISHYEAVATGKPHDGPSSAAPTTAGQGQAMKLPILFSILTGDNSKGAGTPTGSGIPATEPIEVVAELPGDPDSIPVAIKEHPFVRLPKPAVEEIPPSILVDFKQAVASRCGVKNPVPLLQRAHELLSRRFLSLTHLHELAQLARALIAHAMHHGGFDMSGTRCSYAVQRLGLRFLLLDVVVSTLIVLRQTPDPEDWDLFTNSISHDAPPLVQQQTNVGRPNFSINRAQQLSMAIRTLKTGRRPQPAELLHIKRMLFCLRTSPRNFRTNDFNAWRADDHSPAYGL